MLRSVFLTCLTIRDKQSKKGYHAGIKITRAAAFEKFSPHYLTYRLIEPKPWGLNGPHRMPKQTRLRNHRVSPDRLEQSPPEGAEIGSLIKGARTHARPHARSELTSAVARRAPNACFVRRCERALVRPCTRLSIDRSLAHMPNTIGQSG